MILGMKDQELVGIGIASRGYALGINAVVVEIGAVRGLLGIQPLWMHEIDFPNDLVARLHDQTRIGAEEPDLSSLSNRSLIKYKLVIDDCGRWDKFQGLLSTMRNVADNFFCCWVYYV